MSNIHDKEMDAETLRSFSRMVYGHEIWIADVKHEGDEITALGLYGHKLVPDKPMPTDYANVILYDDNGRAPNPYREIINEPHGWKFSFEDNGADVYTLYVDSNSVWITNDEGWHRGVKRDYNSVTYSGAFNMVAKRIISKDGVNPGSVMHSPLEIMPTKATLKVGETAVLNVLYEGKPLAKHKVLMFCNTMDDIVNLMTDENGSLSIPITNKGTYSFIVKYTDESKSVGDEFDETVFSITLTMESE